MATASKEDEKKTENVQSRVKQERGQVYGGGWRCEPKENSEKKGNKGKKKRHNYKTVSNQEEQNRKKKKKTHTGCFNKTKT